MSEVAVGKSDWQMQILVCCFLLGRLAGKNKNSCEDEMSSV